MLRIKFGSEKLDKDELSEKYFQTSLRHLDYRLRFDEFFSKQIYQNENYFQQVADNIAEGHSSYYYQEKIKGFNTARKEAGETQNHIRSLQGKRYIDKTIADNIIGRYEEVIRGINGYINWVRKKKGAKK